MDVFEELDGPGLALGIDSDYNCASNRKEGLKEGQIIVLGTDGIWETQKRKAKCLAKKPFIR